MRSTTLFSFCLSSLMIMMPVLASAADPVVEVSEVEDLVFPVFNGKEETYTVERHLCVYSTAPHHHYQVKIVGPEEAEHFEMLRNSKSLHVNFEWVPDSRLRDPEHVASLTPNMPVNTTETGPLVGSSHLHCEDGITAVLLAHVNSLQLRAAMSGHYAAHYEVVVDPVQI